VRLKYLKEEQFLKANIFSFSDPEILDEERVPNWPPTGPFEGFGILSVVYT
jgi:hypothetical protein